MKRQLGVALALFALAGECLAQSSVVQGPVDGDSLIFFGVADAVLAYGAGSNSHRTRLLSGGNTASRWGLRGVQDLGGGLAATFWLEAGYDVNNGSGVATNSNNQDSGAGFDAAAFNRRSTVSLVSDWGELRLGRDFTATYLNRDSSDPFSTNGVGASQADVSAIRVPTLVRASNIVGYLLPADLSGFFGEVQYFMGENASDSPAPQDGTGYAVRIGYRRGAFGVAMSTGRTQYARSATTGDFLVSDIAASYDFGVVSVSTGYFHDRSERDTPLTGTGYIVGAVVPVGPHQLKAAFSSYGTDAPGDPRADKLAVGFVYSFSKRTQAYMTLAHVSNSGGSAQALNGATTDPDRSSRGYDFGLKHSF
ncbi:porin [Variovorax sp. J22R133]|uniref:porin n=1 Tax=Variovorax brevis TaxID=3053503 RepID=UPI0025783FC6|nr:porin [Variovorax sp. J22R133]MDM0110690.1 porin [Variovorax sp. J22R133]